MDLQEWTDWCRRVGFAGRVIYSNSIFAKGFHLLEEHGLVNSFTDLPTPVQKRIGSYIATDERVISEYLTCIYIIDQLRRDPRFKQQIDSFTDSQWKTSKTIQYAIFGSVQWLSSRESHQFIDYENQVSDTHSLYEKEHLLVRKFYLEFFVMLAELFYNQNHVQEVFSKYIDSSWKCSLYDLAKTIESWEDVKELPISWAIAMSK